MKIFEALKDPFFRIKGAHYLAIILLILNSLFFTHDLYDILIQLFIALIVFLHHNDDVKIKNELISSKDKLFEDQNIFNKNIIVSETDLNGVITYVNSNFCKVTGYNEDELIGSTHAIIKSDKTDPKTYDKLYETLSKNETFIDVLQNKRKDGSYFWVDIYISPIFLNNTKIGYKTIMYDMTNKILIQKKLQNAIDDKELKLQDQVSKFEFAINSSRDGFWDYDLVKKEFYLSEGWKKRLGFNPEEKITYLEYLSLMPDEYRFEHHKAMHDVLEKFPNNLKYIHFRVSYPIVTKNEERLVIEDVGDVFFDEEQNPIRITGFHRDITDQERQAKIIESQNRVAAMGEVMSNVAHQWRQPIGAINNVLNDIEFDIELNDLKTIDANKYLEISSKIKNYTSYLSDTIDDFRKLTSYDKIKVEFSLDDTITQAYAIVKNSFDKNNIEFIMLESNQSNIIINGYQREFQQIILNIFNNAKDALVKNNIHNPKVKISINSSDTDIVISITDNAGGVPSSIIDKIFDPYFTTKHESMGTGIGLYMSKKMIMEYFNGSLEVKNQNNGANFIVTIPKDVK